MKMANKLFGTVKRWRKIFIPGGTVEVGQVTYYDAPGEIREMVVAGERLEVGQAVYLDAEGKARGVEIKTLLENEGNNALT